MDYIITLEHFWKYIFTASNPNTFIIKHSAVNTRYFLHNQSVISEMNIHYDTFTRLMYIHQLLLRKSVNTFIKGTDSYSVTVGDQ